MTLICICVSYRNIIAYFTNKKLEITKEELGNLIGFDKVVKSRILFIL